MRVIHPREFDSLPKKKPKKHRWPLMATFLVIGVIVCWLTSTRPTTNNTDTTVHHKKPGEATQTQPRKGLKTFSGEEFKALARAVKYPNLQFFVEPPPITSNKFADQRIRSLAEARGYVLTGIPVTAIEKIDEPRLEGDDLLQPLAAIAWRDLKQAAERDDVPLALLSAYRSPEYQRNLFLGRLAAQGATVASVAAGQSDVAVGAVLSQAAIPGYSRHHTGYTIDLWCEDGSGAFVSSSCFQWIKADNYKIAKQNGWIPSYAEGVELQGPEPEPWEYVWVGHDLLTN